MMWPGNFSLHLLIVGCFACWLYFLSAVESIGCFVCSSINGSEPECEDIFNNTGRFYEQECRAGRKGRSGKFPGTSCIKVTAKRENHTVMVRDCTVDNGDTTSDTEMGRESHCWMVYQIIFDDIPMEGCALACNTDGCNPAAPSLHRQHAFTARLAIVALTLVGLVASGGIRSLGGSDGGQSVYR